MTISDLHQLFANSEGICTDTRVLKKNQMFFAIKGDNFDGNSFAIKAIELGASHAVVDELSLSQKPNIIYVKDVLQTLQDLSRFHRQQFNIPVIGITGSNGKTTSKELLNAVLVEKFKVLYTEGNLNNHLGVPFTLLRMDSSHEIAIIEMGANKPGDIKELADIALPTHGIITNIGKAHIEGFGGLDGVIKTKTELYQNISISEGELFVNVDDEILIDKVPDGPRIIPYGKTSNNIDGEIHEANPFITFSWKKNDYQSPLIKSNLVGAYNLTNYLLAVCVGDYFGVDHHQINRGISNYQPTNNRSQVTKTNRNTLIVDCYNANPSSMKSAIQSFNAITAKDKLMILGDMLELGHIQDKEHQAIIDNSLAESLDTIFVGVIFKKMKPHSKCFETVEEMISKMDLNSIKEKTILLKGSRGIRLEKLIDLL
ncbi:MAG: UDP-N-acetylmuramoyl-tripeptide--D-alanyl-D-alanine ligase [Crocinitomicaceae bacterium]